jgi:hypothetical protein
MKKSFLSFCAFLAVLSASLCAEPKTVSKGSRKIECQIIPNGPLSKSRLAYSSFARQIGQRMGPQTSKSSNWGGYASYTSAAEPEIGSVTNVWGNWSVPKLHPSQESRYSVCWVGIDGFFNQTVEQIGTLQQWINGQQQNFAWFSVYPGPTFEIVDFPVNPKDKIRAFVSYVGNDIFEMTIENLTQGVFTVVPNDYTIVADTQRNSAEWIVEAPSLQAILPLAHFSPVNFTQCLASIRGSAQAINGSHGEYSKIIMVTEGSKKAEVKASPSRLFHDGKKFIVKWHHR